MNEIYTMREKKIYDKSALVRLTTRELEKAHEKAKKSKLSLSRAFVKSILSDGQILTVEEKEEINNLRFELRKINTNLNQIIYAINATRGIADNVNVEQELEDVVKRVNTALDRLFKKL